MRNEDFSVEWIDLHKVAVRKHDPKYPEGRRLDVTLGEIPACTFHLPYPEPRVGYFLIDCNVCGRNAVCGTLGLPCDPVSIKMPCRKA